MGTVDNRRFEPVRLQPTGSWFQAILIMPALQAQQRANGPQRNTKRRLAQVHQDRCISRRLLSHDVRIRGLVDCGYRRDPALGVGIRDTHHQALKVARNAQA
jgi:hypothetical protein